MRFPRLFKRTSTGAIQFWQIEAGENMFGGGLVTTTYGQLGTESPQTTTDIIDEGKNYGKKNATTPVRQALKEAEAKWKQQLKKGYIDSLEKAQYGELDRSIEGGIVPMLAHKFSEQAHKITYPAAAQPKLDGIRCIAILKDGICTLWSRTRKPITSVPHIVAEIEAIFGDKDVILDGELYNHDLKADFEKIVSLVRQAEPAEGHEVVEYHVYDQVNGDVFVERFYDLKETFTLTEPFYLKLVPTVEVSTEEAVMEAMDQAVSLGYEGIMIRNSMSSYVNKRSYDLQKVKEFTDQEFDIIGIEEGRGKLTGHAIFVCRTETGKSFLAKMKGDTAKLKEYFENESLWRGKQLTVQFQGFTGKEKVPRFPVGKAIRDYE